MAKNGDSHNVECSGCRNQKSPEPAPEAKRKTSEKETYMLYISANNMNVVREKGKQQAGLSGN